MTRLRRAGPEDAELLARLDARTWREAYWGALPDAVGLASTRDERAWATILQRARRAEGRDQTILLAELGGRMAGFVWAGPPRREGRRELEGEIYMLYVLDAAQRRGVGRALMAGAARAQVQRGLFGLSLWVVAENGPARAFYEALGGLRAGESVQNVASVSVPVVCYRWPDAWKLFLGAAKAGRSA